MGIAARSGVHQPGRHVHDDDDDDPSASSSTARRRHLVRLLRADCVSSPLENVAAHAHTHETDVQGVWLRMQFEPAGAISRLETFGINHANSTRAQ